MSGPQDNKSLSNSYKPELPEQIQGWAKGGVELFIWKNV